MDEPLPCTEVVAAVMQVHPVSMPRQGYVAVMRIHARRGEHMGPVDGHALRLVNGRGIAMVDMRVVFQVEANRSVVIDANHHALCADLFDDTKRTVLDPKPTLVAEEHDPVAAGEVSWAAFDSHLHFVAEIAGSAHALARGLVERAHLVVCVGEDDPACLWMRLPVAIPALDEFTSRLIARCSLMHHALRVVGADRSADPAGCQIARGVALPVFALPAHLSNLDAAMTLVNRAECSTGFDRLQLLRIADEDDFCANVGGMGEHALQLARADHAGLIDHQDIARGEQIAALSPTVFHTGDGA